MALMKCKNCDCEEFEIVQVVNVSTFYEDQYDVEKGMNQGGITPVAARDYLRCFNCGMKYGEVEPVDED